MALILQIIMKQSLTLIHVFSYVWLCIGMSVAMSMSKPGCDEKCGNVTVPYPFGIGPNCSANSSFTVLCNHSTNPPMLFLSGINMEALRISLAGTVVVKQAVSAMNCSDGQQGGSVPISLRGSPYTISARYNSLVVMGCQNSVWLVANGMSTIAGCTPLCGVANSNQTGCNGVDCCQTTIAPRLKELRYVYKSSGASNNGSCGLVFPVEKSWSKTMFRSYREIEFVPLVLEWEFGELRGSSDQTCTYSDDYCFSEPDDFGRRYLKRTNFSYYDYCHKKYDDDNLYGGSYTYGYIYSGYDYASSTKYCSCPHGFEGNPYLPPGCTDIDECSNSDLNSCRRNGWPCINLPGTYTCDFSRSKSRVKIAIIIIGSALGGLILLLVAWKSTRVIRKRIKTNRRRKFFKRNGGLLLEQQLSATQNGLQKTKLFTSKELTQATDHYNENRVLGRGGQGTVYKGMLTDGRIVAVKKSQRVEEDDHQVFINEVVILSQINHRNVVKLLGCCLETEVPRLVYEFIPNGTLFQLIHEPNEELPLTWEMRVRIAREVAGALAYLHSASSAPIYHRDIKSTNILLDDKYRAKIADFGTSKSVSIDQTHMTTRVVGTFGYMDPEYFRSSQFTEKSDVYSFGVVMVELLTGEKAITAVRVEAGRSLVNHFLHSMEENKLFEIIDTRVLVEGKREEVESIAEVARRCLHLNGKKRPTMKEVAVLLEGIQMHKEEVMKNLEADRTEFPWTNEVDDESCDFSIISGSLHSDTIASYSPHADRPLLVDS